MKNKQQQGFIGIGLMIAIIVALGVVGGGAYYVGKKSNSTPRDVEQNNNSQTVEIKKETPEKSLVENTPVVLPSGSTDIPDSKNPGTYIYTSSKLGISFSYEKFSRFSSSKALTFTPIENGNLISIQHGDGHITFYNKSESESVSDAVRRIILPLEKNKNCDARVFGENVVIVDSRVKSDDVYWNSDLEAKYPDLKDVCYGSKEYPRYFKAILGTSKKFAYLASPTDGFFGPFSTATTKNSYWFETIKAIK